MDNSCHRKPSFEKGGTPRVAGGRIYKYATMHQYNKNLKPFTRKLRKYGTKGEAMLWKEALRAKQMLGYQFNRQFPVGNYIVDFIARKLKLIIEIDGYSHNFKGAEDRKRQDYLESLGYTILRFSEGRVVYNLDHVVAEIQYAIECIEGGGAGGNPPLIPSRFTSGQAL